MPKRQQILADLRKVTQELKSWLDGDPQIELTDQSYIENHLQIAHMSYAAWKTRQVGAKPGAKTP